MTHHQFGSIAGDSDTGGTFSLADAVLLQEKTSVAVESLSNGQRLPVIALGLSGRVNKTQDTLQTVWVMSVMDAGALAAFLFRAAERLHEVDLKDFHAGWAEVDR